MGGKPVQVLAEDAYWNSKRGTIYPKLGRWSPGGGEEERGKSLGKGRNPMKGFKSEDSRLASLFKKSREQWKQRAAAKQKKLRVQEVKIRDLSASRDHWKERAMIAEQEQRQLEKELEFFKKKDSFKS